METYGEVKGRIPTMTTDELHKLRDDAEQYGSHPGERNLVEFIDAELARRGEPDEVAT